MLADRIMKLTTIISVVMNIFLYGFAHAFCEQPPAKLCNVFFSNDLVVHAKVVKSETVNEEGNPEAGWLYHLEALKTYRGKASKSVIVYSENTTARLLLESGKEYIVFASKSQGGKYNARNYCGEVQHVDGEPYSVKLEEKIQALKTQTSSVIEGEVRDANWNPVSGAELTIMGESLSRKVTVDKNGSFSITVIPGTYKVVIPENLHVTDYGWNVADKNLDKVRTLSVVAGQCVQIQLQER